MNFMIKSIIFFLIVLITNSCIPTEKQKKEMVENTHFDQNIIKNLHRYEKLKLFLENNIDSIIKFRYSLNTAVQNGKPDKIILLDQDCYSFFQGNYRYDISNVPNNIKKELDSLFHSFNEKEIQLFEVCKNRKITIHVKSDGGENGIYISHYLLWNENNYGYQYYKDTLIDRNCIYRIEMSQHGW